MDLFHCLPETAGLFGIVYLHISLRKMFRIGNDDHPDYDDDDDDDNNNRNNNNHNNNNYIPEID
ncbi:hypothetical protein PACTADRAFT_2862 [Pachysolen tannophilus NRRL Y-2460]|uniref:Uncharacterized protein n=1 Tax=Pachysolen tannophilus NRRL Y-2460 TaxID=669874 RepID=A0A1E4TTS5_PACTA|nr:hypothetical protein PACTADRAFT_2862 [Pachysolen tannophilus NRRL Y-2460]